MHSDISCSFINISFNIIAHKVIYTFIRQLYIQPNCILINNFAYTNKQHSHTHFYILLTLHLRLHFYMDKTSHLALYFNM